jgi:hypothetical protein
MVEFHMGYQLAKRGIVELCEEKVLDLEDETAECCFVPSWLGRQAQLGWL